MTQIIATESRSAVEFARRIEAFASSLATPMSERAMVAAAPSSFRRGLVGLIRAARAARLSASDRMWRGLVSNVEQEES